MVETDKKALYGAFVAKDERFDGKFFVGISSTGIYCRPVCNARQPKIENCTFFTTAAEAEQDGFRPCLLCRPELAPGTSRVDATANLVYRAARMLEESCGSGDSIEEISQKLGCTDRHLRRVFTAEYHVTPIQYLQTCRLLLAKNLLTESNLSILEVAMAAGFGSLRRFNDSFKEHYKLAPSALRKKVVQHENRNVEVVVELGYHPPYNWDDVLKFLSYRAIRGIEHIENGKYMRTVNLQNSKGDFIGGWICVENNAKKSTVKVTIDETLVSVIPQILSRVKHLFDLYCEPNAIYEILQSMNGIKPGLCVLGTRVPGCFDSFEMAVRAILGQQITVKAASTLAARIVETYGKPIETGKDGLTHVFPTAEEILAMGENITENFGVLGVTSARSLTILALANATVHNRIDFGLCAHPEEEIKKLLEIKGIGQWTAEYIAMRTMEWTDAFLVTDIGVKKALAPLSEKKMLEISENWRPWRSYATVNLWNSL